MYYLVSVEDKVHLMPDKLVMDIKDAVVSILREKYERMMDKELGLILLVDNVKIQQDGLVIPGDPGIYYSVTFDMVVFKPYVNEVYRGSVTELVEFGAFVSIGPLDALLHNSQIGQERFTYDRKSKAFTSKNKTLKKEDTLIAKVSTVSLRGTVSDTKIGLTMRAEGLGADKWFDKSGKSTAKKSKAKTTKKKK